MRNLNRIINKQLLNNLTYKKKNLLLAIGMVMSVFIVYSFGIKKTINAYIVYSDAKNKMELAVNAPKMAAQLENELMEMDKKIGSHNTREQNTSEVLLGLLTNYCQDNHAVLREFPKTTVAEEGDMLIETNQFMIGGNFSTLINLVYILEQKNKLGKVASVNYQLKKDFKTKEMQLTATVFLQNIKKEKHEK
ncbi:MAG: hypothetical protein ACT4ON_01505 [Bacteroidota bacterium]